MTDYLSRRAALKTLATATGAIGAIAILPAGTAAASATAPAPPAKPATPASDKPAGGDKPAVGGVKPHVGPKDPTAIALSYIEDAGKVDAQKFPTYKAGQACSNCLQSPTAAEDGWRNCNLFPGKEVSAKGWCKVYVKRP
jgi:hypothetical protein